MEHYLKKWLENVGPSLRYKTWERWMRSYGASLR